MRRDIVLKCNRYTDYSYDFSKNVMQIIKKTLNI